MKLQKFDPEMRFGFNNWINGWGLSCWKYWKSLGLCGSCGNVEIIKYEGVCLDPRGNGSYAWTYESQWARGGVKGPVVPGRIVEALDICFSEEFCHWGKVAYAPCSVAVCSLD